MTFHAPAATVSRPRAILQALRPTCWPLDSLVFLPAMAAGHVGRITITAFIGVWFIAAASRIFGQLTDLPDFRQRPDSARHPFAAGNLPLSQGVAMACSLAIFAMLIAVVGLPVPVLAILALFIAVSMLQVYFGQSRPAVFAVVLAALRLAIGYEAAQAESTGPEPPAPPSANAVQSSWRN